MNRRSFLLVAVFLLSGCTASTGSDGTATHVEHRWRPARPPGRRPRTDE